MVVEPDLQSNNNCEINVTFSNVFGVFIVKLKLFASKLFHFYINANTEIFKLKNNFMTNTGKIVLVATSFR